VAPQGSHGNEVDKVRINRRGMVGPVLILGAAITGCAAQPSDVASPTPTSSSASSTEPTSTSPAATPSVAASDAQPIAEGPLRPGWYRTSNFQPTVAFEVGDDGWQAFFVDDADEVYIEGSGGTMVQMTRLSQVVDPATGTSSDAPDDLIAWFLAHPRLEATEAANDRATLAGLPVRAVTYATTGGDVPLFAYDAGNFHLRPGLSLRTYVIQMDGPDLVVSVLVNADGSVPDSVAVVLDSLTILGDD
jgi:hypothetical protein